ncbi:hypothetical protein K438DRAFT_1837052 [Mycena galopus ATCC 62051]|nr:hypothetical protein K438DRAFT_1837052 [Mycena galopus ATCC 62051]
MSKPRPRTANFLTLHSGTWPSAIFSSFALSELAWFGLNRLPLERTFPPLAVVCLTEATSTRKNHEMVCGDWTCKSSDSSDIGH